MNNFQNFLVKKLSKNLGFLEKEDIEKSLKITKKIKLPTTTKFNLKQLEAYNQTKNLKSFFLILHGGVRSGKSYVALYIFLKKILEAEKNSLFIATGYNLNILKTNIDQILFDLNLKENSDFFYNGMYYSYNIQNKILRLSGANNKKSYFNIRGVTASGWYANEVTLQNEEMIFECIRRVSQKKYSFKIWDTNPSNCENYIYTDFILKKEEKNIKVVHFKTEDNAENLSPNYIEQQKLLLSKNDQKVFLDGEWLADIDMPFYKLKKSDKNLFEFKFSSNDRIAFLDPATGQSQFSSKSAFVILFHVKQDFAHKFYFFGKLFDGLWSEHLNKIAYFLNEYNVSTFFYENNLIGEGAIERELEFRSIFLGKIKSIRNKTEKIARILSLVSQIEKENLVCLDFENNEFYNSIKFSNVKDKKNLDAVDALESAYRILTT